MGATARSSHILPRLFSGSLHLNALRGTLSIRLWYLLCLFEYFLLCHTWRCCHYWHCLFLFLASLEIILFPSAVSSFLYSSAYYYYSFAIATHFLHSFFVALYTALSSSSFDCCHFLTASFLSVDASCIWSVHHQISLSTYHPPGHDSPIYDLAISQIQLSTSLYSI